MSRLTFERDDKDNATKPEAKREEQYETQRSGHQVYE